MKWQENYDLTPLNSFRIQAFARYFVQVNAVDELQSALRESKRKNLKLLILGGGSNVLFTRDFDGLVVKNNIKGIEVIKNDGNKVWIKAGAGEVWHDFVIQAISMGYGGVENLSLIPGTVGAAPMQNIGAYGVEIRESFFLLEAVEIATGQVRQFDLDQCEFGYRYSIFKGKAKGKYVITSVTFRLDKEGKVNTSYGAIASTLEEWNIPSPKIKDVSDAVIHIRQSKLPDPSDLGNAGSFFKNPIVDEDFFNRLKILYEDIPAFKLENETYKIPAAWLIEQCGWKGSRFDDAGVHRKHALILVNYGRATGAEIKALAEKIQESVRDKFSIQLEPEVNII